ncbi:MAG TPA: type II CAAX endopeptidase family protein [Lacipirellulaceae bacterium]|nr:type II CAAX endopeptidase family protein [Lacipirellulaceae bacterium]
MTGDGQSVRRKRDLAAVAVAMVLPTAITWLYFFGAAGMPEGVQRSIFAVVKVVQFALPAVWVAAVQRERLGTGRFAPAGVWAGLAFGVVVAAAIVALYAWVLRGSSLLAAALPEMQSKVDGFGISTAWQFAALGAGYSLVHSLLEEYYWRWFVFGQLQRWTSVGWAVAISSLGFMAHHVLVLGKYFGFGNPATYALSACVAVGGAVWAAMYRRTGSLLGPWLSHMLVDAAIFGVGYALLAESLGG